MKTSTGLPYRTTARLQNFDYSLGGMFFVTICTYARSLTLSTISEGVVTLTSLGNIAEKELHRTIETRAGVILDDYVVMPNHLHALLFIPTSSGGSKGKRGIAARADRSLASTIGGYKGAVTRAARRTSGHQNLHVWQSGYHEHIVRTPSALERLRAYVRENPMRWSEDRYYAMS